MIEPEEMEIPGWTSDKYNGPSRRLYTEAGTLIGAIYEAPDYFHLMLVNNHGQHYEHILPRDGFTLEGIP